MEKNRSNIKVSVVMPVYNSGDYLKTAVESILAQSLKDFELILVDDGSTDGSSELCDEYARKDSRVKVIHQRNGGICSARNAALKIVCGEYIAFSDHDDEYLQDLLKDCYNAAKKFNADVVKFAKKEVISSGNRIIRIKQNNFMDSVYQKNDIANSFFDLLDRGAFTCVWDGFIRKGLIEKNQIFFDPSFKRGSEDIDYMFRLIPYINTIVTISKTYYVHYIRKGFSTSSKYNEEVIIAKRKLPLILLRSIDKMKINIEQRREEYSYYLMKEFFNYLISLYSNPNCLMLHHEKIEAIRNLSKETFVPEFFLHQSVYRMFRKSKKFGLAYFLYKYKLFELLFLIYRIRLISVPLKMGRVKY